MLAGALRRHRSAMELDEMAHDPQPESQPPELPPRPAVSLAEAFEQMRSDFRLESNSRIADGQAYLLIVARKRDTNLAARRRELDRVRQQVPNHLLEAVGIDGDRPDILLELRVHGNALRFRGGDERVHRRVDERLEKRGPRRDVQLAGHDT